VRQRRTVFSTMFNAGRSNYNHTFSVEQVFTNLLFIYNNTVAELKQFANYASIALSDLNVKHEQNQNVAVFASDSHFGVTLGAL